jgi:hypothetical protein
VVYASVIVYYVWLSLRARSFFWFSTSNPGIENSGFIGESKTKILEMIPKQYVPKYITIYPDAKMMELQPLLDQNKISFPFIAKPDVGERGQGVEKIYNLDNFWDYHRKMRAAYLVQEFIDYSLELGVFYYRIPGEEKGMVSSVVIKDFLKVTGDGISTLEQLIRKYPRARFRMDYLAKKFASRFPEVIPNEKELQLENIGNHVRGTTFLNGNYMINEQLNKVFDQISNQIHEFYFGRFDIRCKSMDDLYLGQNIKILELNGSGSEPAHIYQPGFSFWEGQKVLLHHWKVMWQISMANHRKGMPFMTWREARKELRKHSEAIQRISPV